MSKNEGLIKNTFILSLGTFVPKMISFIVLPLLTFYLSTDEYGVYDLILSIASFLVPLLTLQIQQAAFRYLLSVKEDDDKDRYVTSSITFIILSAVIVLPISYCVLSIFIVDSSVRLLVCLLLFSESHYTLVGQLARALGSNLKYAIAVILYAVLNLILLIFFLVILKMSFYSVIWAMVISYFTASAFLILSSGIYRHIKLKGISKYALKEMLEFSLPIVPSSVSLWVVNLSDRLIVSGVLGTAANGIYAVANKVPNMYSIAYNTFNLAWTETAARSADEGDPSEYYSDLFDVMYKFMIGIMICLIACTPILMKILVNEKYDAAYYQMPILYFGVFFNSIVSFYGGIYVAIKRTKQVGISSLIGAVLNAGINLLLINKIGLYAASFSTAISFAIISLYRAWDLNKVIKISYKYRDLIFGFLVFILCAVLCYQRNLICFITITIIAVVYNIVYNKQIIHSLIKIKNYIENNSKKII